MCKCASVLNFLPLWYHYVWREIKKAKYSFKGNQSISFEFHFFVCLLLFALRCPETCWPVLIPTLLACAGVGICAKTTRSKGQFWQFRAHLSPHSELLIPHPILCSSRKEWHNQVYRTRSYSIEPHCHCTLHNGYAQTNPRKSSRRRHNCQARTAAEKICFLTGSKSS